MQFKICGAYCWSYVNISWSCFSILCSLAGQRCAETLYQICRKQNRTGAAKDGHMHAWPYSRLGDPGSVVDRSGR